MGGTRTGAPVCHRSSYWQMKGREAQRIPPHLRAEGTRWPHSRSATWKPDFRNGHSTKAESFMRTRTRGSWPERVLRGRIHYCRLIETKSQKSTCRSRVAIHSVHTGRERFPLLLQFFDPRDCGRPCARRRPSAAGKRKRFLKGKRSLKAYDNGSKIAWRTITITRIHGMGPDSKVVIP